MACAAGVLFFNLKGDLIIYRLYQDGIDLRMILDVFRSQILKQLIVSSTEAPVRQIGSWHFVHQRANDVLILSLLDNNTNANVMSTMSWMSNVVKLLKAYFNGKFKEKHIRNNFVLVYELLEEAMEFGVPQITDAAALKALILQKPSVVEEVSNQIAQITGRGRAKKGANPNATLQVTGAQSQRTGTPVYKKNELFLDIVEKMNVLSNPDGQVLRADINGIVTMTAKLSGTPEVRLGLNDQAEDISFPSWVNLGRFDTERQVTFVPPDGEFKLCSYRITSNIQLPFKLNCAVQEQGRTRLQVTVKIHANYSEKLFSTNMKVKVPVPRETARRSVAVSTGKTKFDTHTKTLDWTIPHFTGGKDHHFQADITLISTTHDRKPWARPPLQLEFSVPMFSASGVRVTFLRAWEKSGYKVDKWVRRVCAAGDYSHRI